VCWDIIVAVRVNAAWEVSIQATSGMSSVAFWVNVRRFFETRSLSMCQ
jgi:hypothetical protein